MRDTLTPDRYPGSELYPLEAIEKRIKSVTESSEHDNAKPRPRILIIYTGGTIGMIENPETGALEPFNFEYLVDNVPKMKRLDYDIDSFQFNPPSIHRL